MAFTDRLHNRGSISTGYDIDNSFVQEYNSTRFVQKNWGGFGGTNPTNTKATVSYWHKRASSESGVGGGCWKLLDTQNSEVSIMAPGGTYDSSIYCAGQNESLFKLVTTAKFRDTSAWYHVVASFDSTQATASDRIKLYVNGVRITDFSTANYPAQNSDFRHISENSQHHLGHNVNAGKPYGYFSDLYFIWDQAKDATDFGEFDTNGIWRPIEYTGTFGTYGYYWDFSNTSNYAEDQSGNGNDGTSTNTTAAMQSTDTPTNNFCTFSDLMPQNNPPTITEGATKSTGGGGTWNQTWGNIGVKNGKWYYEFKVTNNSSTGYFGASTTPAEGSSTTANTVMYNTSFMVGGAARIDYYYWQNGSQVSNESTGWGAISTNDIIGIALDLDSATKTFTVYKNGTALSGTLSQPVALPTNMQDEFIFPLYVQYENRQDEANFGGYSAWTPSSAASDANGYGTFEYAPPSGYYAICSKNLAQYG